MSEKKKEKCKLCNNTGWQEPRPRDGITVPCKCPAGRRVRIKGGWLKPKKKVKKESEHVKIRLFGVVHPDPDGMVMSVDVFKDSIKGNAVAEATNGVKCIVELTFRKGSKIKDIGVEG